MWAAAAHVHEVQRDAVDLAAKVLVAIHRSFLCAPVEAIAPVGDEFPEFVFRDAVLPTAVGEVARPASAYEPISQIVERAVGNVDAEAFQGATSCRGMRLG